MHYLFLLKKAIANSQLQFFKAIELFTGIAMK